MGTDWEVQGGPCPTSARGFGREEPGLAWGQHPSHTPLAGVSLWDPLMGGVRLNKEPRQKTPLKTDFPGKDHLAQEV